MEGLGPGVVGAVAALHGPYYAANWNLGPGFEARVAIGMGQFALRYDPASDLVLTVQDDAAIRGSLVLDLNDADSGERGSSVWKGAHLRFFVLDEHCRGTGLGRAMLERAMAHVDAHADGRCWLTTFAGLDTARRMYERHGFVCTQSETGTRWGFELTDQTFERRVASGERRVTTGDRRRPIEPLLPRQARPRKPSVLTRP